MAKTQPTAGLNYSRERNLTPREIAELERVSYKTVLTRIRQRKLKAFRNLAGKLLVTEHDYNASIVDRELKMIDPANCWLEIDMSALTDDEILDALYDA